eukprot:1336647-Alexandrium_andersonii.AAC.1
MRARVVRTHQPWSHSAWHTNTCTRHGVRSICHACDVSSLVGAHARGIVLVHRVRVRVCAHTCAQCARTAMSGATKNHNA